MTELTQTPIKSTPTEIEKCFALLEEGKIKVQTGQKDAVVVLGMTGSGKTTLVKFLTDNNDDLVSEAVDENLAEFTIVDKENKISRETILSKTIFPELNVHPQTGIAFYDGIGFSDTRGLAVDLAGALFLHKVIVGSEKVRFVLVINHSSVKRGMDRGDFLELIKHYLHLVKNVDKYVDSVAIIISKVENQMTKKGDEIRLVPDAKIVEKVAKFLTEFKNSIPYVAQGEEAKNMLKVVDALLGEKDSKYAKIAIFRRPDDAGPLSGLELLQEGKKTIMKVISQNLKSTITDPTDFGLAISEETKNKLLDVIAKTHENIAKQIGRECEAKKLGYKEQQARSTDMYEMRDKVQTDYKQLRDWLSDVSSNLGLSEFLQELRVTSQSMAVPFVEADTNRILNQGEYIAFLEMVGGQKPTDSIFMWKTALQSYLNYLKETSSWFEFLIGLHAKLSSYNVQKDTSRFTSVLEHPVVDLWDERFVALLKFCDYYPPFNNYREFVFGQPQQQTLGRVLNSTLRHDLQVNYHSISGTYEVRGNFVKLSDAISQGRIKSKFLNVFGSQKIFIDVNVTRPDESLQGLSLLAPVVDVVTNTFVNLDGANGCCTAARRAEDGSQYWSTGRSGRPGAPGKSAANFFGLANSITNSEYLRITANGGQGVAGQDGGHGGTGYDGESPITEDSSGCHSNNVKSFGYSKLGGFVRRVYCVYGQFGGNGGMGGDGGAGGQGGLGGNVNILTLDSLNHVIVQTRVGTNGAPGHGGEGGKGGRAGRSWNHQKMLWWWRDASCSRSRELANEYGDCAATDFLRNGKSGSNGLSGVAIEGSQAPMDSAKIDLLKVVQNYKEFLGQIISNDTVNRREKTAFVQKLDRLLDTKSMVMDKGTLGRIKRRVQLPRDASFDKIHHPWIIKDCFGVSEWPIIGHISNDESTTASSVPLVTEPQLAFNEALILADYLIRSANKTKLNYWQDCKVNYEKTRACALEFISEFEKILSSAGGESVEMDFDPVDTLAKLEREIINGKSENIGKILLDSIDSESPERKDRLRHHLQNILSQD